MEPESPLQPEPSTADALQDGVDTADDLVTRRARRRKRWCVGLVFLIFAGLGVAEGVAEIPGELDPAFGVVVALLAFIWCRTDAAQHGDRPGTILLLLVILVAPVGLTIYLLSRRRIATVLKGMGTAVALVLIASTTFALADCLRHNA